MGTSAKGKGVESIVSIVERRGLGSRKGSRGPYSNSPCTYWTQSDL